MFEKYFLPLKEFKDNNGHLKIPIKNKLYGVLKRVRIKMRQKEFSDEQIEQLNKLGVSTNPKMDYFKKMSLLLEEYISLCNKIPKSTTVYKNENLGFWYYHQIDKSKNGYENYKIKIIQELQVKYPTLCLFDKQKLNQWNTNFSRIKSLLKDKNLNEIIGDTWLQSQKALCKKGTLTNERIKLFESIGIDIKENIKSSFRNKLYTEIKAYKEEFGDIEIHIDYVTKDGYELGNKYHSLRSRKKHNKINEKFIETLKKEELFCDYYSSKHKSKYNAMSKKSILNTSGYIGVGIINEYITSKGKTIKACAYAELKFNKVKHRIGKYEPTEKGLLEGAIDRDLYIIEKNLPNTRNFTDEELLENIYKLEQNRKDSMIEMSKKDFIKILENKITAENF